MLRRSRVEGRAVSAESAPEREREEDLRSTSDSAETLLVEAFL